MGSTFSLAAGAVPSREIAVAGLSGREGISRSFAFDVDVACERDLGAVLGASAVLSIGDGRGVVRAIHGVVARVAAVARPPAGRAYRLRLVPKLWLGKRRRAFRVFQGLSAPEVVKTLLDAAGVPCEPRLAASYPKRDYCAQYRESDYAFVRRILAEEGIFWFVRHSADAGESAIVPDAMVLIDHPGSYERLDPAALRLEAGESRAPLLRLRASDVRGASDDEILRFARAEAVRPDAVMLRDYDFRRPLRDLAAESLHGDAPGYGQRLRIDDFRGDYADPDVAVERAARRLEAHRRRAVEAEGESSVRTLVPGYRVEIEAAGSPQLNGEYAVTELWHEGRATGGADERVYTNRFRCVPVALPARPRRPKRRVVQCLETAVVVGPSGEEIHTDEHGRVQVKFHWSDGAPTAWLRVVQSWAGASWGAQFIPRVGSEVMVSFLGGDPDCPVVVGSLHNPTRPHPFKLPEHKTKSGVRTASSPGGGGFNELSFEDAAGEERVFLHAQRDLAEEVRHDHTTVVGHSQRIEVKETQENAVGGDRHERIAGDAARTVGRDDSLRVDGSRREVVGGDHAAQIDGELRVRAGSETRAIRGAAAWSAGGDVTLRSKGNVTTLVGTSEARRSYGVIVDGPIDLSSSDVTELASKSAIRLRCGASVVEILPDRIELIAPALALRTPNARLSIDGGDVTIHAKNDARVKSHTLLLAGDKATASLRAEAKVDGARILLNSPELAIDPPPAEADPLTRIELADEQGKPLPYRPYVIALADGSERRGFLDGDGRAEIDLREPATIRFPGLLSPGSA